MGKGSSQNAARIHQGNERKKKKQITPEKKKEVSLLKCNNNGNKKQKSETGMEAVELEEFVV